MLAISFENAGGPEVLKVIDIEKPCAEKKEVVIKVVGAGVNRPDLLQREGNYPAPLGHSKILGLEVSGYVDSIGKDVKFRDFSKKTSWLKQKFFSSKQTEVEETIDNVINLIEKKILWSRYGL